MSHLMEASVVAEGNHPPDSLPHLPLELLRIIWPHLQISLLESQQGSASNTHQYALRRVSRTVRDAVSWLITRTRIFLKHEGGDWHNLLQSGLEQLTSAFPRQGSLQHLEIFVHSQPRRPRGLTRAPLHGLPFPKPDAGGREGPRQGADAAHLLRYKSPHGARAGNGLNW